MLKAVIFDFNGVILDDEPVHFRAMQATVKTIGVHITEEEYWNDYLPLDDVHCLQAIGRNHGLTLTEDQQRHLLAEKSRRYYELLQSRLPVLPGVERLIRALAARYPMAIASGARREEIEKALSAMGVRPYFRVVVAAEDFTEGKPHPESFLFALERLNAALDGGASRIRPAECLVFEDSVGGVQGVLAAGMVCVAVANTYAPEKLAAAHRVVGSLEDVDPDDLAILCGKSR